MHCHRKVSYLQFKTRHNNFRQDSTIDQPIWSPKHQLIGLSTMYVFAFFDCRIKSKEYNEYGECCILFLFSAPEKCQAPLDLIFLLDASGSVGASNYVKEKEFIKIVVSRYDLETVNQAAVIVFSRGASNVLPLGSKKTSLSFATAVDNIPYNRGTTRIDLALRLAYDEYFLAVNSNETQKLVILLTDGIQTRSNSLNPAYIPIENTVELLRQKSARIFAVAIGHNIAMSEMRTVTEKDDDIFLVTEFNDLVAKADAISKTSCADSRKHNSGFML